MALRRPLVVFCATWGVTFFARKCATQSWVSYPLSAPSVLGWKPRSPRPLTPLAGDAVVMSMGEGFTIAQHAFGSPLELRCRMVNNYFYAAFVPDDSFTPPTRDLAEYGQQLEKIAFGIGERWTNEWEPSLIPILQQARTTDFDALSDADLLTAFARSGYRARRSAVASRG